MKSIDLGKSIQILANVGVIAGILFLAVEIRQNNELLATQARYERADVRRSANLRYIENPELIRVTVAAQNGAPLTEEDSYLLERAYRLTLDDYNFVYEEYRRGLLDERSLPGGGTFRRSPGMEALWNQQKESYDPEFAQWVEETLLGGR